MSILFFSRLFYPHIGGVETHVLEIAKLLIKDEFTVTVVTEQHNEKLPIRETFHNVTIHRIPVKQNWFKKFYIWKWFFLHRDLIKKSDIIHCHDVFFWYLPFRFVYYKKPVYTTFHGYETVFPPEKKAIFIRKISEKLSWGNICIGDFIAKWYGTKPDYVLYGGTNVVQSSKLKIKSYKKTSKLKIVFIGRLEEDTGVKVYLKTLDYLQKKGVPFLFEAFGDGTLRTKIEQYGKVHGVITDIKDAARKADIIFSSSYLIMLTGLIFGKVIIAVYDNPLKEDYLKDSPFARFIFVSNNSEEIAEIINSIKNDSWKHHSMIKNGSKWARDQSWNKVAQTYLQLWRVKIKHKLC